MEHIRLEIFNQQSFSLTHLEYLANKYQYYNIYPLNFIIFKSFKVVVFNCLLVLFKADVHFKRYLQKQETTMLYFEIQIYIIFLSLQHQNLNNLKVYFIIFFIY